MRLTQYVLDAFADGPFTGNPAAVVPLESWLPDSLMQAIAGQNNLSETAFFVPKGEGYLLRWFTPEAEIDLCGHATLATGAVVLRHLRPDADIVRFETLKAGVLTVTRDGERFTVDLPSWPPAPEEAPSELLAALGGPPPAAVLARRDWLIVYDRAEDVTSLAPDMAALARIERKVIVTAPGSDGVDRDGVDFISRFFAAGVGVPEDPVTGSAHSCLVPYWAVRLGKTELNAFQASRRGGRLACRLAGDRVILGGAARAFLEGVIDV